MSEKTWVIKLKDTIVMNIQQAKFGSYAAELSFFILLSIIPLMLAFANVIAILPIDAEQILGMIRGSIPPQFKQIIVPILEQYLKNTSSNLFSLGLIFSLWPASNVFNILQRIMNEIYKTKPRPNFVISRLFAYLVTIIMVILAFLLTGIMVFGESILKFVEDNLPIEIKLLSFIIEQGWIISVIIGLIILVFIYYFIPNVKWPIKFAFPGACFSLIGFSLVSLIFPFYLSMTQKNHGSQVIGVFIILMLWLYFNSMVVIMGGYINVLVHDYHHLDTGVGSNHLKD